MEYERNNQQEKNNEIKGKLNHGITKHVCLNFPIKNSYDP